MATHGIVINGKPSFGELALEMGVFGLLVFAVYPLSVARAHDIFGGQDAVAVSAGLLFAYSIGASISPLLASGVMTLIGSPFGLFVFWGLNNSTLAGVTLYLRKHEKPERVPLEEQVSFIPMKSTCPVSRASLADRSRCFISDDGVQGGHDAENIP